MSFYVKLAIFWVVVVVGVRLLRKFPNSTVSQAAFSWNGPFPYEKESLSHYKLRWALYSFKYSLVILVLLITGVYLCDWLNPTIREHSYFQVIFLFGLPLLFGMTVVGGLGCLCKSAWHKLINPSAKYCETAENKDFEQDT